MATRSPPLVPSSSNGPLSTSACGTTFTPVRCLCFFPLHLALPPFPGFSTPAFLLEPLSSTAHRVPISPSLQKSGARALPFSCKLPLVPLFVVWLLLLLLLLLLSLCWRRCLGCRPKLLYQQRPVCSAQRACLGSLLLQYGLACGPLLCHLAAERGKLLRHKQVTCLRSELVEQYTASLVCVCACVYCMCVCTVCVCVLSVYNVRFLSATCCQATRLLAREATDAKLYVPVTVLFCMCAQFSRAATGCHCTAGHGKHARFCDQN